MYIGSKVFCCYWLYWTFCNLLSVLPTIVLFIGKLLLLLHSFQFNSINLIQSNYTYLIESIQSIESYNIYNSESFNYLNLSEGSDYYIDNNNNNNLLYSEDILFDLKPLLYIYNSPELQLIETNNLAFVVVINNNIFTREESVVKMNQNRFVLFMYNLCFVYDLIFCTYDTHISHVWFILALFMFCFLFVYHTCF